MTFLVIQHFQFGRNEICEKPIVEKCATMTEVAEAWKRFRSVGVNVNDLEVFEIGGDMSSDPDVLGFLESGVA